MIGGYQVSGRSRMIGTSGGEAHCTVILNKGEIGLIEFITIEGKKINEYRLSEGNNSVPFGLTVTQGIYLYRVWVQSGLKITGKIVKVE